MADHKIFSMSFSRIYRLYTDKVVKKGRTEDELKDVIRWLTGYAGASLEEVIAGEKDMAAFFSEAPGLNPSRRFITGRICGIRVEEVEDPLMREIRYLDKLVDELARGKFLEKILGRAE